MEIKKQKIGNKEVFPFTIPSGIITTEASTLERIANEIPEIGILTTKSIGLKKRLMPTEELLENKPENIEFAYREPILSQYAPYCFVNAVGLTNPGADEFAEKLEKIKIPEDKFLLISIFGKDSDEFIKVASKLEKYTDGFKLNLSCPHAKDVGMMVGQDPKMVDKIVYAVRLVTKKPVFAKLTPNVTNIADIAEAAMQAGAYGITAINTLAGYDEILTNKNCGISGRGIMPRGVKCVKDITERLGRIPIIGCGGIATANDVIAYARAGASFFGIGTALAGMSESEIKEYFPVLFDDIENGTNNAEGLLKLVDMEHKKYKVYEKTSLADDFHILKMDKEFKALPGQFVFAYIPGKGEKPFSVMDDEPFTIAFSERGCFTKELGKLNEGDEIYFRGPYGNKINIPKNEKLALVGGGTGIAGIYLFAKGYGLSDMVIFVGAKDKNHIPLLHEIEHYGDIKIATEDGSKGYKGLVTNLLEKTNFKADYFINCGPKPMVEKAIEIEKNFTSPEKIYSSIEYMTKCGVGICGSCANEKGLRTCVEGPFMMEK